MPQDVAKVVVIHCLVRQSILFLWIAWHFFLRPIYLKSPFMGTSNIMLQPQGVLLLSCLRSFNKLDQRSLQLLLVNQRLVPLLAADVHVLSDVEQFCDHLLAEGVGLLAVVNLMPPLELCGLAEGLADFVPMLVTVYFEEFVAFELCVDVPDFVLFLDFFSGVVFILDDDVLVFPGTPDLVLYLFLLPRYLLDRTDYGPLTPSYLNHLVTLLLLHDHLAPSLLPLVPPLLRLSSPHSSLLTRLIA